MTDAALVAAFESCTLPRAELRHAEHVRLAFLYLTDAPLSAAVARFASNLQRFADAAGVPHLYHETLTWGWMLLVNERLERSGRAIAWEAFAAAHADLMDKRALARYYRDDTLSSPLARRVFILPDRLAEPSVAP